MHVRRPRVLTAAFPLLVGTPVAFHGQLAPSPHPPGVQEAYARGVALGLEACLRELAASRR